MNDDQEYKQFVRREILTAHPYDVDEWFAEIAMANYTFREAARIVRRACRRTRVLRFFRLGGPA